MTDYIALANKLRAALDADFPREEISMLREVYDRMTPQVNGMDESCWTIGMHKQVSQELHDRIRDLLAPQEPAVQQLATPDQATTRDALRYRFIRKSRAGFSVVRWTMRGKKKTDEGDILREEAADAAIDDAIRSGSEK